VPRGAPVKELRDPHASYRGDPLNLIRVMPAKGQDIHASVDLPREVDRADPRGRRRRPAGQPRGPPRPRPPLLRLFPLIPRRGEKTINIPDPTTAPPRSTPAPPPASRKIYARPDAAPELRVPVREIALTEAAAEPPIPVYDTTGPYTDPDVTIDV